MNYGNKKIVEKQSRLLDYLITENEIRTAVKKSKIVKSPFLDKIRNKIIKASLNDMLPVYYKLVNAIINSGTMPQTWCGGLITPIYKSGTWKKWPVKLPWYLCFKLPGKLFCSILHQRLLEHVVSRNILYKSQVGFLPIKLYSRPYFYTTNPDRQTRS